MASSAHGLAEDLGRVGSAHLRSDRAALGIRRGTPGCTIATVPRRYAELGDLHAGIDDTVFLLDTLLDWGDRDERDEGTAPST